MPPQPLVSVVIPAYNCSEYIKEALDSVLNQNYDNIEIIVVNDGSTDNTSEILDSYKNRIRTLNQKNSGAAVARSYGITSANGEYIAFLDSDDLWLDNKLSLQVEYLESHKDVGMVYCDWLEWSADGDGIFRVPDITISNTLEIDKDRSGWLYNMLIIDCYVHTSTVLIRKQITDQVGEFDKKLRRGQDYDYWFRASRLTEIHKLHSILSLYRIHSESITKKPHAVNYGIEVLTKTLNKWGNIGPNGQVTNTQIIRQRLATLWFGFGYEHYINGDKTIALNAFISAIKEKPTWASPWIYVVRTILRRRKQN